jgi:hypothetical protein
MILEQLAVLVYGVLAMIAALVLSSQVGSPLATALVFVSAGLTYVFQAMQSEGYRGRMLVVLWGGVVVALLASVSVSLWSAF